MERLSLFRGAAGGTSASLLLTLPVAAAFQDSLEDFDLEESQGNESTVHPHFFSLDYQHVQVPFEITLWIMLASLAKIGMLQTSLLWTGTL